MAGLTPAMTRARHRFDVAKASPIRQCTAMEIAASPRNPNTKSGLAFIPSTSMERRLSPGHQAGHSACTGMTESSPEARP